MLLVDTDKNAKGQKVRWNVELWKWTNYLRRDTETEYKTFNHKVEAQEYIQEMLETTLCVYIRVWRLTYDNITWPILPTRKCMYEWDLHDQDTNK